MTIDTLNEMIASGTVLTMLIWSGICIVIGLRLRWILALKLFLVGFLLAGGFIADLLLPDTLAHPIVLVICISLSVLLFLWPLGVFIVHRKRAGKLLLSTAQNAPHYLILGVIKGLVGILFLIDPPDIRGYGIAIVFLSASLRFILVSVAFWQFQVRENGLLTVDGKFLRWQEIESYDWKGYNARHLAAEVALLNLRTRKPSSIVRVAFPSKYGEAVADHLEKHLGT